MKIAIGATGRDIESSMDATFHRCSFFLIVDMEKNTLISLENTTKGNLGEIGAMVGQIVANEGIDAVIASDIGLKAFEMFERYGIKVYHGEGKIKDIIRQLKAGGLPEITKAALLRYIDLKQRKK